MHLGHQHLFARLLKIKAERYQQEALTAVVSFYPHPAEVLIRGMRVPRICTLWQTRELLSGLGIDLLLLCRFSEALSNMSAEDFLRTRILDWADAANLVMGPDAAVGKDREADAGFIGKFMQEHGREAEVSEFLSVGSERASSRAIRKAICEGALDRASAMLGRRFCLEGHVVRGEKIGRKLKFPTLNLRAGAQVLPPSGVYATRAQIDAVWQNSVTNIGYRPTFGGKALSVETHVLDLAPRELYGRRVQVEFVKKIREELRFESAHALQLQIAKDVETARMVLKAGGAR